MVQGCATAHESNTKRSLFTRSAPKFLVDDNSTQAGLTSGKLELKSRLAARGCWEWRVSDTNSGRLAGGGGDVVRNADREARDACASNTHSATKLGLR